MQYKQYISNSITCARKKRQKKKMEESSGSKCKHGEVELPYLFLITVTNLFSQKAYLLYSNGSCKDRFPQNPEKNNYYKFTFNKLMINDNLDIYKLPSHNLNITKIFKMKVPFRPKIL